MSRRSELSRRAKAPRTIDATPAANPGVNPSDWFPDYRAIAFLSCFAGFIAFLHFARASQLLLYGDAVAHMNIARRVVDSRTPGLLQLGTVWLPLPHLAMLPFIWSTEMWQTGVAGSIPSMLAYVASVVGIFRLLWIGLSTLPNFHTEARVMAWLGALVYALNPNILYLQSTAMTEVIYLAFYIWATVYLAEFAVALHRGDDRRARHNLVWCGVFLLLAALTRYDGWFASGVYAIAALWLLIAANRRSGLEPFHSFYDRAWRRAAVKFVLLLIITPIVWLTYNALTFGDPLSFARGPYSARAIEAHTRKPGDPHHPGWHAPQTGAEYFVKSAELNLAGTDRTERIWLYAVLLGSVLCAGFIRALRPWLLLWTPLPFYAISMAWGGVPIFIPTWWPHSYYNVRYGTQLIPAFVVFGSLLMYLFMRRFTWRKAKYVVGVLAVGFVAWSYYSAWHATPISLKEAEVNAADRTAIERGLSAQMAMLPPNSTVLMYIGQHGGALQRIAFPLKRTINEGNFRYWQSALMDPARMADFVVATDGDPVAEAIKAHPQGLQELVEIQSMRQQPIRIYRSTMAH